MIAACFVLTSGRDVDGAVRNDQRAAVTRNSHVKAMGHATAGLPNSRIAGQQCSHERIGVDMSLDHHADIARGHAGCAGPGKIFIAGRGKDLGIVDLKADFVR